MPRLAMIIMSKTSTTRRRLPLTSIAAMVVVCSSLLLRLRPSLAFSPTFTSKTNVGSCGKPTFLVGPVARVEPFHVRDAAGSKTCPERRTSKLRPLFATEENDEERRHDAPKDDKAKKDKKGATPTNSKYDPSIDYDNIELEFVDYADPNYAVDQGVVEGEEGYNAAAEPTDEDLIEEMREDRRRRNDEFQFQTYFRDAWNSGTSEFRGVWTKYGTTTFIDDMDGPKNGEAPGILRARVEPRVISSATKAVVNPDAEWRGDREVIVHEEYEVTNEAAEPTLSRLRDTDTDSGFGRDDDDGEEGGGGGGEGDSRTRLESRFWPTEMRSRDFRGPQGNMCVGNAYTICDAIKLYDDGGAADDDHEGPFSELRAELGVHGEDLRMRVKFEYLVKPTDDDESSSGTEPEPSTASPPPLHLSTVTVCRERRDEWPVPSRDVALFSTANVGARGGLYDPPPCGGDEQSSRYMALDLEGGATVLFPHSIDQRPDAFDGNGWVFSLDWTPGTIRYQVDRKFGGGLGLKGLKTLELSEVEALEADTYRPKDGPADMRQ